MHAWSGACSRDNDLARGLPVVTTVDSSQRTPVEATQRKAMFINTEDMKEKIREDLKGKAYDVKDLYHEQGIAQKIARSDWFEYLTLTVILLNAFWIAIETDSNKAETLLDAHPGIIFGENFFCGYFFLEWLCRFLAFKRKLHGFTDAWFIFDSLLVGMMVIETWVMTFVLFITDNSSASGMGDASVLRMARLLRLTRMARMVRLLRAVPELMILLKGMAAAMRSVFFTFFLLLIMIYLFGILFTQLARDNEALSEHFSSVPESMYTLMMRGAFLEGLLDFTNEMRDESYLLVLIFSVFIMLASLTLMNMLIGVLCEVVSAVASTEKEALEVTFVKMKLQQVLLATFPQKSDQVQSGDEIFITKEEYKEMMTDKTAIKLLDDIGVDVLGLLDLIDFLFDKKKSPEEQDEEDDESQTNETLSFGDLMEQVLELRGSNNATVKDVMNLRHVVRVYIDSRLEKIERQLPSCLLSPRSSEASGDRSRIANSMDHRQLNSPTEAKVGTLGNKLEALHADGACVGGAANNFQKGQQQQASCPSVKFQIPGMCPRSQDEANSATTGAVEQVAEPVHNSRPTSAQSARSSHTSRNRLAVPAEQVSTQGGQMLAFVRQLQARVEALDGTMHQVLERLPPRP